MFAQASNRASRLPVAARPPAPPDTSIETALDILLGAPIQTPTPVPSPEPETDVRPPVRRYHLWEFSCGTENPGLFDITPCDDILFGIYMHRIAVRGIRRLNGILSFVSPVTETDVLRHLPGGGFVTPCYLPGHAIAYYATFSGKLSITGSVDMIICNDYPEYLADDVSLADYKLIFSALSRPLPRIY